MWSHFRILDTFKIIIKNTFPKKKKCREKFRQTVSFSDNLFTMVASLFRKFLDIESQNLSKFVIHVLVMRLLNKSSLSAEALAMTKWKKYGRFDFGHTVLCQYVRLNFLANSTSNSYRLTSCVNTYHYGNQP